MLIRRPESTPATPITIDGVKDVTMRVLVGRGDGAPTFALRHFTVEPGGYTPRHSHDYEHEVVIVGGSGEVEYGGETHPIREGDVLFVEPNVVHQFRSAADESLAFLCLVPISFDCGTGERVPTPGS